MSVNGERISETFTTQRKAREWITKTRREIDTETYVDPSDVPFGKWWAKWQTTYKSGVRPATYATYTFSRDRTPQELLDAPLCKITHADIQRALNSLTASRRTIEITKTHIHMCLARAVTDGLLKTNPCQNIELPSKIKKELPILSDEEYAALVKWCTSPPKDSRMIVMQDILYTILNTGMRRDEAINLLWSDWTDDMLRVRGTKTVNSFRSVPLVPEVIDIFTRRKKTAKSIWIFESFRHRKITPSVVLRCIHNLNGHRVHDLRHTFATRCIAAGIDAKTLSEILGHADVETTMRLYVHPTDDSKREAIKKLAKITQINTAVSNA